MTVTWQAANGNGSAVTAYLVTELNGLNAGQSVGAGPSDTSAVLGGLAGGSAATFAVAGVTACGTGTAGLSLSVTPTGAATTYASTIVASAPYAYYRLGDAANSLMADSSASANDGAYTAQAQLGGASAIPADPTTSLGSDPNVSCCGLAAGVSSAALPSFNTSRTIEAWINTTQLSFNPLLVGYGVVNAADQEFVVSLQPQGIAVDGRGDYHVIQTARPLGDGEWHYLTVTYDGAIVTAYLDGVAQGTAQFNAPLDTQPGTLNLTGGFGYNQYQGRIQDVAVYGTALSAATVSQHFAASGYGVPLKPFYARTTTAGPNAAAVSWASTTAPNATVTYYRVTAVSGPNTGESIIVSGDATATRLTGLAAGAMTVQVVAADAYGESSPLTTNAYTVTGSSSTYSSNVLGLKPSVYYRLADSSTNVMADSSPNSLTGSYTASNVTLGGAPALASDPATSLSDQHRQQGIGSAPASSALPLYASARSAEIWFNSTWTGTEALMSWGQTNTDNGFTLLTSPSAIAVDAYNDQHAVSTPYPINDGIWHMIGVTFDGTTNVTVYLDGVAIGTTHFNNPLDTLPGPFVLGAYTNGSYQLYSTSLADAALFPVALTSSQVSSQFSASGHGRPKAPAGLSVVAGANQATVSWTTPATAPGSTLQGYLVTAFSGSTPTSGSAVTVPASAMSAIVTGLTSGVAYTFHIVGVDSYGLGGSVTSPSVTPTGSSSTYVSTVLGLKPSVFYRMADSSTAAMADSSPNRKTGSYVAPNVALGGPAALVTDPASSLGDQQRQQGIGSAPASSVLPLYASARSVEVWAKTTWNGYQGLVSWGQGGQDQGFTLATSPSAITVDAYNDQHAIATPYPIDDGAWHMIGATVSGMSITVYLDGVAIGTTQFNYPLDTLPGLFVVGSYSNGANQLYSTSLADAAVFPTALTSTQMASQFAASGYGKPTAPAGLSVVAGANQATVSWTTSAAAPGTSLEGYLVTAYSGTSPTAGPAVTVPASAASAVITGLTSGVAYTIHVAGVDSFGSGAAAVSAAVTPTGSTSTYVSTVLGLKPSLFYRLADSSTGAMADSSPNAVTGSYVAPNVTLGGPAALVTDPASSLNDQQRQQGIGSASAGSTLPLFAASRSVEVWAKTTWNGYQGLVSWGQANTDDGFTLATSPSAITVDAYNDQHAVSTPYPINDGAWHMIGATVSGTSIVVYLDGVAIGATQFNNPLDTLPGLFVLGSYPNGVDQLYSTSLADAAVFSAQLTAAQMASQFAAAGYGTPTAPAGLSAAAGANQATVSWTTPATAPGSALQGYVVTAYSGSSPTAGPAVTVPASATSAVVTGLAAGTAYTFHVAGVDSYGLGAAGATATGVTPTGSSSTYASTVLGLKPSVFYRMADSSAAALADSSANSVRGSYVAANVTLGGPAALVTDPASSLGDQQRQQGIASAPAGSVLPSYASARSVEVWLKTTWTSYQGLVSWGQSNTDNGFTLAAAPSAISVDAFNDQRTVATPYPINDGVWHMIGATVSGTNIVVYLDGVAIGTAHFSNSLNTLPGPLVLGSYPNGVYQLYSTSLADAAVFPAALTPAQMASQFAASGYGTPTAPGGLSVVAGANQATVSWTTPATAPGSTVRGYIVTAYSGTTPTSGPAVSVPGSATSAIVTGLTAGTAYNIHVAAVDTYGTGAAAVSPAVTPTGNASTYVSTTLGLSPSVFYRLADGSTTAMTDSSPHRANGTYDTTANAINLGASGPLAGDPATAVQDNGVNIGTAYTALPSNNSTRTFEVWLRTSSGNTQCMAGWGSQMSAQGFDVCMSPTSVYVEGYGDDLTFSAASSEADGNWHFVAVTATATSATVYVDGTSIGTQSFPIPLDTALNTPIQVGSFINGGYGFGGELADLAVFPSVLTAAQIGQQYKIGTTGSTAMRRPALPIKVGVGGFGPWAPHSAAKPPAAASRPTRTS